MNPIPILYDMFCESEGKIYRDLTDIAKVIASSELSSITLVDEKNQWFRTKLEDGTVFENPRENSFAYHAILNGSLEVMDATQHELFKTNPFVTGESIVNGNPAHIRFFYGRVIYLNGSVPVACLSVADNYPRSLSQSQKDALDAMARQVGHLFTVREKLIGVQNRMKMELITDRFDNHLEVLESIDKDLKSLIKDC